MLACRTDSKSPLSRPSTTRRLKVTFDMFDPFLSNRATRSKALYWFRWTTASATRSSTMLSSTISGRFKTVSSRVKPTSTSRTLVLSFSNLRTRSSTSTCTAMRMASSAEISPPAFRSATSPSATPSTFPSAAIGIIAIRNMSTLFWLPGDSVAMLSRQACITSATLREGKENAVSPVFSLAHAWTRLLTRMPHGRRPLSRASSMTLTRLT
mmetsp:Transcript_4613/g.19764  ORF Transcript_4613/g.19764 Transcript_4613/m.19764 type:complete len:211 (+) Transcript_4613:1367-1999(+)